MEKDFKTNAPERPLDENFKNGQFYDYPISKGINSLGKETANKINNEIKNVDKKLKEAKNYYDYTLNLAGPTLQEMFFTVYPEKYGELVPKN